MEQQHDGAGPAGSSEEDTGALRSAVRRSIAAAQGPSGPRGDMYNTFGQGFSRAFELAITPALFGAMGYGLDRWLGTLPVFTAVLSLLALIGMLLRTWYGYCHRMEALEAEAPWARKAPTAPPLTAPAACPNAMPAACPNAMPAACPNAMPAACPNAITAAGPNAITAAGPNAVTTAPELSGS